MNLCGLRGHEATYTLAIQIISEEEHKKRLLDKERNEAIGLHRQSKTSQSEHKKRNYNNESWFSIATATSAATITILIDEEDSNTNPKSDGRKSNIGYSTRMRDNTITKYKHIVGCEEFMDE